MDPKSITELVEMLKADQETAYKAYHALEAIVMTASAPGRKSELERVAAELAATIPPQLNNINEVRGQRRDMYTDQNLVQACRCTLRLMSYVAGPDQVPVLVQALDVHDVREMARYALDRRTGPETTEALIRALNTLGPRFRTGVVGALGRRGDSPEAMAAVQELADDDDSEVALAAIENLPNFACPTCDKALRDAMRCKCPRIRARAMAARVRLADKLMKNGHEADARRIFKDLAGGKPGCPQSRAAMMALAAG